MLQVTQVRHNTDKLLHHSKILVDSQISDVSGGGLTTAVEMNRRPKVTLYGVLSRGVNCEDSSEVYPDIYMNVKFYFKWILDNMS